MAKPKKDRSIWWWLGGWLLLNLLQAGLSPVDADEAYYWMYAHRLDWGYFDHPPAVAALIALGKDWLPGALGLRFGHVLAGTLTVWVIWDLLGRPLGAKGQLVLLLITAQPMLQVYGFIATPDGPLLLAAALLLRQYKKFLQSPTFQIAIPLGILMAAILYAKYHGILLIFLMALPNLGWLVRQPLAWMAAGLGALLYLPHLYWQYANDFPSFRYHLSGRNDPYELKYTLEYLGNQLLIFNPLFVYFYVLTLAKKRGGDRFARAARWLVLTTLAFFLYSTLKGGTEAQWTAMLTIPLVYLLTRESEVRSGWDQWLRRLALVSWGLFLLARIGLMLPRTWLPFDKPFDAEPWVNELNAIAGDLPVVFENSYRDPSHYQFYASRPATTFTNARYRPNQYDLWRGDSAFHEKDVLLVSKAEWTWSKSKAFTPQTKRLRTAVITDFQVGKYLRFTNQNPVPDTLRRGERLPVVITAYNDADFHVRLDARLPLYLYATFQDRAGEWTWTRLRELETHEVGPAPPVLLYRGEVEVPRDLVATDQLLSFGVAYLGMPPLRGQSDVFPVTIE